jgi:hypothetical protein
LTRADNNLGDRRIEGRLKLYHWLGSSCRGNRLVAEQIHPYLLALDVNPSVAVLQGGQPDLIQAELDSRGR